MITLLNRIASATQQDLKHKNVYHMIASATEELGEFSAEVVIEDGIPGHAHKQVKEGSKVEAVDFVICALSLFYARGGTNEELVEIGHRKMAKWEDSQ